jgi:hypothetical protein
MDAITVRATLGSTGAAGSYPGTTEYEHLSVASGFLPAALLPSFMLGRPFSILYPRFTSAMTTLGVRQRSSSPAVERPSKLPRSEAEHLDSIMADPVEVPSRAVQPLDYRNKLVLAPMVRTGTRECHDSSLC